MLSSTGLASLALVLCLLCATSRCDAALRPVNLRCEYLSAPLGIDRPTPRLSWIVEADRNDERQTAYHVLVASSAVSLAKGVGDLWDSGPVQSDDTLAIAYAGKALTSGQRVWWQVRTADRDGVFGPWSEPQTWSMGLLSPGDWTAEWIGFDAGRAALERTKSPLEAAKWITAADEPTPAPAGERWYEKTFTLPDGAPISTAELVIAADDAYDATINDRPVGRGSDWRSAARGDVRGALRPGQNVIRVRVKNDTEGPTGLIATLTIGDKAGSQTRIVTDASWQVATGKSDQAIAAARELGAYGVEPWGKIDEPYLLPPPAYVRCEFALDKPIRRATLYAATLGLSDVYVNGERVNDDYFSSGWTDYKIRSYYRTYDVTDKVRSGNNAIGATIADGWFSGHVAFNRQRDWYGKHPRLRAQLEIEFEDGTRQRVETNGEWKGSSGPTLVADFLAGETYDARREMPGWAAAEFDASAWAAVDVGAEVSPQMQAHPSQPVRAIQTFAPKAVTEPTPGTYIVDFGQNLAGVVRLKMNQPAGTTITIRHAERLNPDGTIYTTNLRTARATDRYTCKGGGVEAWSPRFTFHGFQYVEIVGLDAAPTAETLVALGLSSDTPVVGTFESSDATLNQLHRNIYQTQAMNFIDVPTDCPQRDERLGWTGDAQIYIRTATLNTDVHRFFDKWLIDLADQQREDGQFPTVAPLRAAAGDDGGPAWADAGVICPWTIYDVYGDREVLARQYPSMQRFIDFMVKRSTPDLLPPAKYHAFGDWLSINAETPKDLIYVAYFAHDADLMQRAATALGKTEDAQRYAELFARLKRTFRDAFVDADGRIQGDTQCGYVLAIAFDLLDDAGTAEAGRRLVANIEERGNHLSTGFIGTKDLMLALDRIGRNDVAYRLVHQDTFPSWAFSIRHGATSIWERWNGWTPEQGFGDPAMNSFAHYSFGAVYQWMAQTIGGIRNGGDAYRRIVIEPTMDAKLTSAKTSYTSIRGTIATDWTRDGDRVTLRVSIPANTTALIRLPTTKFDSVRLDGERATDAKESGGRVEIAVGSGTRTYVFDLR